MDMPPPLRVSEYIQLLNKAIETLDLKIIGEVTSVKISSRGHVYFSLKDSQENAVLDCVIWKGNYDLNGVRLENGQEVIIYGYPEVYPSWGKLSIIVKTIEPVGEGALKEAYEKLKRKLTLEGLFADERKRPLPDFPQRIGVITSMQGAVIHDFENNIGLHGYKITTIDSRVEGQEALPDLLAAIRTMKKQDIEVLILMRGGGSLQSLAAFDNETIIREVVTFPVPVIAAIGHHQDVPLVSFAADLAVSTPTAAAALLNSQWMQGKERLNRSTFAILDRYQQLLDVYIETENRIRRNLYRYESYIEATAKMLNFETVQNSFDTLLEKYKLSLDHAEKIIEINNPERLLRKGFSILRSNGKIIKSLKQVQIGEQFEALVSDGTLVSVIKSKV